ncbi:plasmid stabilization protein ParE, partial [Xanthomonas cerealis]|uniref:plasmid stabilization protein ParE n=2 Tax=Xanthomonas cerealis TaxID=3390025 RepID=UPI00083B2CBC
MSNASHRAAPRATSWVERLDPWIAAIVSAVLHLLMLLLLLLADPPTMNTPQGAASGGRTKVDFIGATRQPVPPVKTPLSPQPKHKPAPVKARPATSPVQSTLVAQADDPVPPPDPVAAASAPALPAPTPAEQPAPPQPDPAAQQQTQAAASEPEPTRRRETWTGRPPGAIDQDLGPNEAGLVRDGGGRGGRRGDLSDA